MLTFAIMMLAKESSALVIQMRKSCSAAAKVTRHHRIEVAVGVCWRATEDVTRVASRVGGDWGSVLARRCAKLDDRCANIARRPLHGHLAACTHTLAVHPMRDFVV